MKAVTLNAVSYEAPCVCCAKPCEKGTPAYWAKGVGIWHLVCGTDLGPYSVAPKPAKPVKKAMEPKTLGVSFEKVYSLFALAKTHLKYPKLRFGGYVLYLSDKGSMKPGVLNLKRNGKWCGRIVESGAYYIPHYVMTPELETFLMKLALDPFGFAAESGKAESACCFCGKGLTTKESVSAGWGPICADHWGLPWGTKKPVHAFEADVKAKAEDPNAGVTLATPPSSAEKVMFKGLVSKSAKFTVLSSTPTMTTIDVDSVYLAEAALPEKKRRTKAVDLLRKALEK